MTLTKLSDEQIVSIFGDFGPYLNEEGIPSIFWEELILIPILLPAPLPLSWDKSKLVSGIKCHKLIAPHLSKALTELYAIPEVWSTINDYGGCYNFRPQRKSKKLSRHAWAIAIDLDVTDNPFSKTPIVHPTIIKIFEDNGFLWGGNFPISRRDGMHWEFCDISKL